MNGQRACVTTRCTSQHLAGPCSSYDRVIVFENAAPPRPTDVEHDADLLTFYYDYQDPDYDDDDTNNHDGREREDDDGASLSSSEDDDDDDNDDGGRLAWYDDDDDDYVVHHPEAMAWKTPRFTSTFATTPAANRKFRAVWEESCVGRHYGLAMDEDPSDPGLWTRGLGIPKTGVSIEGGVGFTHRMEDDTAEGVGPHGQWGMGSFRQHSKIPHSQGFYRYTEAECCEAAATSYTADEVATHSVGYIFSDHGCCSTMVTTDDAKANVISVPFHNFQVSGGVGFVNQ